MPEDTAVLTYRVSQMVAARDGKSPGTTQKMTDTSTWVRERQGALRLHTETPAASK